jgi:glycosyltransferase involved in cell wall biosynthesis
MNSLAPLVTVVVPCFNEEPHIVSSSLESIRNQSFENFECIVVDESTRPELAEACRNFCAKDSRFIYIHPPIRLGLPSSLNLAISKARGQLIARFDSDDVCNLDRFALQVAFLQSHPEITVVGGALNVINDEGKLLAHRRYPVNSADIEKGMHLTTTLAHPTVMFRKLAIEKHNGYNADFRFSEDLDLWLRWLNAGLLFANLPQVLVQYRQNYTRRDTRHWQFNLKARTSNFGTRYLIRRIIGIVCIAVWCIAPSMVQEKIFKVLLLRRNRSGAFQ